MYVCLGTSYVLNIGVCVCVHMYYLACLANICRTHIHTKYEMHEHTHTYINSVLGVYACLTLCMCVLVHVSYFVCMCVCMHVLYYRVCMCVLMYSACVYVRVFSHSFSSLDCRSRSDEPLSVQTLQATRVPLAAA